MDTRREFLSKILMLGGAAGVATLPASIQRAFAIDPEPDSTFFDAEHIVLLMQENRSFDHAFGTLRGVRGFNDPRAIQLPNNNAVWLQTNAKGETYAPFRLDIKDTKITWMGSLPHGRHSQVGAYNNGRHDNWIEAKKSDDEEYTDMPLTMGYYTREDIPFYYALADAFTVCDHNFCSSLAPTNPNRLHFWSGTVRAKLNEDSRAFVDNDDIESKGVEWRTFPELLEENNISWKVYQNELNIDSAWTGEEDSWLGNFGDNALEFFKQYNVKHLQSYVDYLPKRIELLQADIKTLQSKLQTLSPDGKEYKDASDELKYKQQWLQTATDDQKKYTAAAFNNLSQQKKSIHKKAFVINEGDPYRRELVALNYTDGNVDREINIPKGDVLFQFRKDVESGNLPTVSWLVPPENFSDHPSAPWFGSWYLSETIDILTKNPEVWKKTIFILTYDENDGYYDHVPPFVAPQYQKPETGSVSNGIDTRLDHVKLEQDIAGPIGLGFRVPMVIASPWSRGGYVNSEVFDHTSCLQFLELFLNKKFGKNIKETNITPWRRTVCGDLTSTFRKFDSGKIDALPFLKKDAFIEGIHKAKFKNVPSNYKSLSADEIGVINKNPNSSSYMPQQEKGIRPACPLPYDLSVEGALSTDKTFFSISMVASNVLFEDKTVGCPFTVYNYGKEFKVKNYAATAGDQLFDKTMLTDFENDAYNIRVYAPNGFYRSFKGDKNDPPVLITFRYDDANWNVVGKKPNYTGKIVMSFINPDLNNRYKIRIIDNAYKSFAPIEKEIPNVNESSSPTVITLDVTKNFSWYDFSLFVEGNTVFEKRYAGHVETGRESKSDPVMGAEI
jgi:phospholipase C